MAAELPRLPASVRSPSDGPGLIQFRVLGFRVRYWVIVPRFEGLGLRVEG